MAGDLQHKTARLTGALNRLAQECRLRLQRAERGLPDLPALVGTARQRLDDRAARLVIALPNMMASRHVALERAVRGLPDLPALITAARQRLDERMLRLRLALPNLVTARRAALTLSTERLRTALRHATTTRAAAASLVLPRLTDAPLRARLREAHARLEGLAARLESVSYQKVLARGYALVSDSAGTPVTSAKTVKPGMDLRLRFADGETKAIAAGAGDTRQSRLPI